MLANMHSKPFGIRKHAEKFFSIISKIQPSRSERKFDYVQHNAKIEKLAKLAQIENSEPPVPPDSKNTQFVNFGPKLWKFMQ